MVKAAGAAGARTTRDEGTKRPMFTTRLPLALLALALLYPGLSPAQTRVEAPPTLRAALPAQLSFPATFGVPSAVAPRAGTAFVGASFASPRAGIKGFGPDGDLVLGYNVGDPVDGVSLTFGLALTGLEPFGNAGALSLSASRLLRAGGASATFRRGLAFRTSPPGGKPRTGPRCPCSNVSHRMVSASSRPPNAELAAARSSLG